MIQQRRNDSHPAQLVRQGYVTFRSRKIPSKFIWVARPGISSFPTDFEPEPIPVFPGREPNFPLHGKAELAFRVKQPKGINRLQVSYREIFYFCKIQPFSLNRIWPCQFAHFLQGHAVSCLKVLLSQQLFEWGVIYVAI